MSRALDASVKRALEHGDHSKVYDDISNLLTSSFDDLLEIELLGTSHPLDDVTSFLQDSNAVAMPKVRLAQAFVVARRRLLVWKGSGYEAGSVDESLRATAVMLLMDPEQLTAANTRKQLLLHVLSSAVDSNILLKEKYLIDSLITSRLHRHTKSPNLWSHRRWLIQQLQRRGVAFDVAKDLRNVIFVSGERHPRNYYAWCHARFLLGLLQNGTASLPSALLPTMIEDTKKWCYSHHDDISGWCFLTSLLETHEEQRETVFKEVVQYATSFRWRNESVWYFLRNMASSETLSIHAKDDLYRAKEVLEAGYRVEDKERKAMEQAMSWMERYPLKVNA